MINNVFIMYLFYTLYVCICLQLFIWLIFFVSHSLAKKSFLKTLYNKGIFHILITILTVQYQTAIRQEGILSIFKNEKKKDLQMNIGLDHLLSIITIIDLWSILAKKSTVLDWGFQIGQEIFLNIFNFSDNFHYRLRLIMLIIVESRWLGP